MWLLLLVAAVLITGAALLLQQGPPRSQATGRPLVLFVAAGLRTPVEEIVSDYEAETGATVELQYGGSNTLLNQLQVNQFSDADLYLAADDAYTDKAVQLGLAAETLPIAQQRPVVAVRRDSEADIRTLEDLLRDDVTVAVADPDAAAVGKAARKQLQSIRIGETTRWQQLKDRVTESGVFKPTVNEVANDVKIGAVDAAIVWDSTVAMPDYRDELKAVPLPELETEPNLISIAVLKSSPNPTAALKFARYVSARDRGLQVFKKYGTRPVEGDVWAERPEITFFCGAVNRRAAEQIIADFQEREGVVINTVYDGCGILTSKMQTIDGQRPALGFPDVYLACDLYYLENVRDWFQEAANVSDVELVLAVPAGSGTVTSLEDLVKPGVRVAVGEPNQCTIGVLTRRLLEERGLYKQLKDKQGQPGQVVVEKPSSALLVPDVVTGHVDAAVAYITDVLPNRDRVDLIRIDSDNNKAVQPFSIARTSDHKYLVRRLFRRIAESEQAFESAGFHFRLDDAAGSGSPAVAETSAAESSAP